MNSYLFYRRPCNSDSLPIAAPEYSCTVWKPSIFRVRPKGLPFYPFAVWWIFHQLRLFANREYSIVIIHHQGLIVHRSVITPKYFRFPFMGDADLQVGDTWTHEKYRGRGLAKLGLEAAMAAAGERQCWYLVEEHNLPSIRVAEKLGFNRVGTGARTSRLVALLGSFVLQNSNL